MLVPENVKKIIEEHGKTDIEIKKFFNYIYIWERLKAYEITGKLA